MLIECCVLLVGVDGVMYIFVVCRVGKMAQDVGMVESILWCHPHLVWLVFEGSIPTCACFHSENFFVTLFIIYYFLLLFTSQQCMSDSEVRDLVK